MRIIGGYHRGRLIKPPAGLPVRPTTDLAKESLFNILNNHIDFEDIRVLDLFAGTGNISLEFASRGAIQVTSIENNNKCCDFITKASASLQMDNLTVIRTNVFTFLNRPIGKFDVIFADPPYDMECRENIPELIFKNGWLSNEGWFIMEHDQHLNFSQLPSLIDVRKYGKVHFSFFRSTEK
jgi:16S rRNA (guanine(966)-N(2))-methyltransferase RsmD